MIDETIDAHHCNCCGATRGNMICDDNDLSQEQRRSMSWAELQDYPHIKYGFLCSKCHRIMEASKADIARLRQMVAYVERSRSHPPEIRCKACGARVPQSDSPRPRYYCNDACKQRGYRRRHKSTNENVTIA